MKTRPSFLTISLALLLWPHVYAGWVPGFDLISAPSNPNSAGAPKIMAVAASARGELFIAGDFNASRLGTSAIEARHIARWDGTNWNTVGTGINGPVRALLTAGTNLYAGGAFTLAGGVAATNIARWDGTNWSSVGAGLSGRFVHALLWKDGQLIAGGAFTNSGGRTLRNASVWDGSTWSDLAGGIGSPSGAEVTALLQHGADIIAGGFFSSAGGTSATNIARFDGNTWQPLGEGVRFRVLALTINPNGSLFAGGGITPFGPAAISHWDGAVWTNLYTGDTAANTTASILFWHEGHLYTEAAHMFPTLLNKRTGLARLDQTGWTRIEAPFYPIQAGPVLFQDQLAFGGTANTPVTLAIPFAALWSSNNWKAVGAGTIGTIQSLAFESADLIAAGRFNSFMNGTTDAKLLTRLSGDIWAEIHDSFRSSSPNQSIHVRALATMPGRILTTLPFSYVVVSLEGTNLVTLGTEFPDQVQTLAVAGTNLYAGGSFGVRAWNGTEWSDFGGGINGLVLAIAGRTDSLYVGGSFSQAGNTPAQNIAHWDGRSWSALGEGVDSNVWAIALKSATPGIFVGGDFANAGQKPAAGVAEWDGTKWSSLSSGVSIASQPGQVKAIAVSEFDDVYVAGRFDQAGAIAATNIAFWKNSNWFALGEGITGTIANALALKNGELYVGGNFSRAGSAAAYSVALWREERPSTSLSIERIDSSVRIRLSPSGSGSFIESSSHLGAAAQWLPYPTGGTEVVVTNFTQESFRFFREANSRSD